MFLGFSQTQKAEELFNKRLNQQSAIEGAIAYLELANSETKKSTKCFYLNKAAYLKFFTGALEFYYLPENATSEEIKKSEKYEQLLLTEAQAISKECRLLFADSYNASDFNTLNNDEKNQLAESLSHYGTAMARYSEISGNLTAIKNWPEIKKAMKLIINLSQSPSFYYGAFRTLGIANTKMPSPFGSKDDAKQYLETAVKNTLWSGRSISLYPYNSIALAGLYMKTGKKSDACAILNEVISLKKDEIEKENPKLIPETYLDQKRAIKDFETYKCN